MLDLDSQAELRHALELLSGLLAFRLAEREAVPGAAEQLGALARRPLGTESDEALPEVEELAGDGPLAQLIATYDLTAAEAFAVVAALAPELDEKFDVLYAYLSDRGGSGGLTGEALRTLLAGTFLGRLAVAELLGPTNKLRGLRLLELEPGEHGPLSGRIALNPELAAWLLGRPPAEPEFSDQFPAQLLKTVHEFDDLVLPADVIARLRDVLDRIRTRAPVVSEWGFAGRHDNPTGYHVLLQGPPGTGKTMTAAVLGRESGRPVFRIDLAAVVSKYIGETQKSLARVFDRAETRDWILFFDEADALFGKRADVQDARDRYANQEVSYLLQRLEAFGGVAILATNLARNIDPAFLRRIHTQIVYAAPGAAERAVLWRTITPPELPLADDLDLTAIAEDFELTGAEIRNAVFHAAHHAYCNGGTVTSDALLDGIRAEYEKGGRMFRVAARSG